MIAQADKVAEAYASGRRAGCSGTSARNPYTDQLLKETWDAGYNDGGDEAASEE
jgi:ribosome modulation factor